jgi:predicted dithiol-disulfide oxidoreductase (DUF899 family)
MTEHQKQIEVLEQEIHVRQAKLSELRRQAEPKTVRDYELAGPGGKVTLSSLFGEQNDLIVIHNMGASCPYCTLWADGFNGMLQHFEDRAAFVVVSPDAPDAQKKFADSRGWQFRMLSNGDSKFTEDMGYMHEHQGKMSPQPGFSTFHRDDSGTIHRIAHASFGPGDPYCGIWHMIDALKDGAGAWQPRFSYS